MKTFMRFRVLQKVKLFFTTVSIVLCSSTASAQAMNCDGVSVMYGMWNNFNAALNTITPINYTTGAVGAPIRPAFNILNTDQSNPAVSYYGSTTLSADPTSRRFFFMNRSYDRKNIYTTSNTLAPVRIDQLTPVGLNGNWFVKLAVGTNGFNYSMATPRKNGTYYFTMPTKLIRFPSTCATNNCVDATVLDLGSIQGSALYRSNFLYNGDIAFSVNGDMFLFGSEIDTTTNKYVKSRIYRIRAVDIPSTNNPAHVIPLEFITDINGLGPGVGADSVTITGACFDLAGNFYLSANDTAANWESSYLYRGTTIGGVSSNVTQIATFGPITNGYKITDLASCTYPNIQVLSNSAFRLTGEKKGLIAELSWVDLTSIESRYYILERKLDNEVNFREISTVDASEIQPDGEFHFKDDMLPSNYELALYRVKSILVNGTYSYSNTTKISGDLSANNFRVKNNPFVDNIQMEINAARTGKMDVALYNETGMLIMKRTIQVNKGRNQQYLSNLSYLKNGVYVLKASNENEQFIHRLVKQ